MTTHQRRTLCFDMQSAENSFSLSPKHVRVVSSECEHFFIGDDSDGLFVEFDQLDERDFRQEIESTWLRTATTSINLVEYDNMKVGASFKIGDRAWQPTSLKRSTTSLRGEVCHRPRGGLRDGVCQRPCRDLHVRGVTNEDEEDILWNIVLDSGSDATVLFQLI